MFPRRGFPTAALAPARTAVAGRRAPAVPASSPADGACSVRGISMSGVSVMVVIVLSYPYYSRNDRFLPYDNTLKQGFQSHEKFCLVLSPIGKR